MLKKSLLNIVLIGTIVSCAVLSFGAPAAKPSKAAKAQPVSFTTRDGWTLSAVYLPALQSPRTVILLHDLNKDNTAFAALEEDLAAAGIGYLALDLRGHGKSTGNGEVRSFAREGVDNEFNKMTQDVQAAVDFLEKKRILAEQIVLLGVGLGANVAAKSAVLTDVTAIGLINPAVNLRDVLVIPSMRLYKGDVLIGAAAGDKKAFLEASVIRNVAFLTTGEGKVTFLTAYEGNSHELLDKYFRPTLVQWLKTPHRPEVQPDGPALASPVNMATDTDGIAIAPSATEEALVPSLLGGLE